MAEIDTKTISFIGTILGGFIGVVSILYFTIYSPLDGKVNAVHAAVSTERVERVDCDEKIKTGIEDKLDRIVNEQVRQGKQLVRIEASMKVAPEKN
jgi:hypothetical protein